MKVKAALSNPKPQRKSLSNAIQKKKNTKTTGGVLKNIVKITDAFEELKAGNDFTGISCSKEPKPKKKTDKVIKKIKDADSKVLGNTIKNKSVVTSNEKKPKKEKKALNGIAKSKILESMNLATKSSLNDSSTSEPKLDIEKVEAAVKGLFQLVKASSVLPKNELWDEATPIHLVVTAVKMGVGPKRIIRIALPNSLITDTTDICLIVPDLIRGRDVDHEKTYHHYKDLLAQNGLKNIKTILPARQIRVEFNEYEARRNLCHSHDVFLIDQKISGFMVKKLGKEFYIKRKFPITVKLNKKHLKAEIESKLHKTSFFIDYKGSTKTVQVGHMQQTPRQVAENIIATFNNLAYNYPGGLNNIRCLLIKCPSSESLPLYYSMISRNDVKGPYSKSQTYSKEKEVEGELFGKRVIVKPNGEVAILSGSEEESDYGDDNDKALSKKFKKNDEDESAVEEDNEEDEIQLTEDKKIKNKSNNDVESDEEDIESEDGDDAEAEYLIEFEQTKKLQSKKKRKRDDEESNINESNEVKKENVENKRNSNQSFKHKAKNSNKSTKKKKLNK